MMGVISLRLKDKVLKRIDELSRLESKDKSTIARELLEHGWEFLMVKYYKKEAFRWKVWLRSLTSL
jgi:predicted DNA-binding protein